MTLFTIGFLTVTLVDVVDILMVTTLFVTLYSYFKGSRAGQMLIGLAFILLASFLFRAFGMVGMTWLIDQVQTVWVVAFVILFQPELRRLLVQIGTTRMFRRLFKVGSSKVIREITEACEALRGKGWGAIMVLQRETGLRYLKESGTLIKAEVGAPILLSIFSPSSPLHDGAVIISGDAIEAAQCILPLPVMAPVDPTIGTRHRAAIGLTEDTDAVVVVVSEERRQVSVAVRGTLHRDLDAAGLTKFLLESLAVAPVE